MWINSNSVNEVLKLLTTEIPELLLRHQSGIVKQKTVFFLLYLFLGVFVFNHVAELIDHHQETAAYCCELEELEELSELEDRLKSFSASELVFIAFHLDVIRHSLPETDCVWSRSLQRAFFPHSLHVPIYLDKGAILV